VKRIAVYGAGGFGKEIRMLINLLAREGRAVNFAGYLDDFKKADTMARPGQYEDVTVAIADVMARQQIVNKLKGSSFPFESLIHPGVYFDSSNNMGVGCLICGGVQMTVDIRLGDFVIINLSSTIGHDVIIGDYTSIMPSVNVSGNVKIGNGVFIGSGAMLFQGITVGDGAVIGAGAVVRHSVPPGQRVAGVPSRGI
jgi:sugar O-acyltransferase (sialic acid O-acetyltransferase NeuD family)